MNIHELIGKEFEHMDTIRIQLREYCQITGLDHNVHDILMVMLILKLEQIREELVNTLAKVS